ncbi:MAG: glycoside hydrolase family 9 protein [Gemmatimonadota bacterium]
MVALLLAGLAGIPSSSDSVHIRINQMGYRPDARKVAVVCALQPVRLTVFTIIDAQGRRRFGPAPARGSGAFGPCVETYRLDFSALRREGDYLIVANGVASPLVQIASSAYRGAADTLLYYMRQQRSGFNPVFRDSVHKNDARLVDHPTRAEEFIPVSGGWADAADYLQYVTTSANATFLLLQAARDHGRAFADLFDARGLPGPNQVADVLDEARHGLEWLLRMFPEDSLLLNQLGDDRDHSFWDLPVNDSSDYGWGRGSFRPVYPCTGKPQGLFTSKNRSTGLASTAGKYAAAFALGAAQFQTLDPDFARRLRARAIAAFDTGERHPGVCQTAPGRAPYFYEEENWADDMELGAAALYALTREPRFLQAAQKYAAQEPVTPWMGRDTARHYEFFPWHNNGHYELSRAAPHLRPALAAYYRRGLEAVAARAGNGFRVGIPFIWCSNNLMASFATQAVLYRRMTGDDAFLELETAALDWLFGTNPWGMSMVIGLPSRGRTPRHPHSVMADRLGVATQLGGLVDGPVYRSIFQNLRGIRLLDDDEYAPFNTGFIVYHDDLGDYSTNEPIMDGTANLAYLLGALGAMR